MPGNCRLVRKVNIWAVASRDVKLQLLWGVLKAEQMLCTVERHRIVPSCTMRHISLWLLCFLKFNILPTSDLTEGAASKSEINGKTKHQES